ncbi:Alpha/Beta hydrolase protein [Mycena galericulata]|nr:Alpha/Beta hydrolase protein [Mycena galericulata]KAJ7503215.1 Alpha/Beta hydrolase protein [Mycena galericulata]
MQARSALTCLFFGLLFSTSSAVPVSRDISSTLYDNLVLYTKYSSAAYQLICPSPLGQTLVQSFSAGDTQGFIAQDDTRQEIVVSFRGTSSIPDAFTDIELILVPFVSPSLTETFKVHQGFLAAYNSVADDVLEAVTAQLAQFPTYSVIVTGHSLGAAIAALSAVSLKAALPSATTLQLYTFGQPRTGDPQWAAFAESTLGVDNIFRGVHTFDGVPTIIPQALGYEHHATEYWQFEDPLLEADTATVKQCVGGEDPTCSDSIPSTGINAAHVFYFGQVMAVNPLLCI